MENSCVEAQLSVPGTKYMGRASLLSLLSHRIFGVEYRGYVGIMEKKMETTIMGSIGVI